jgi:hypothetical protein
MVLIGFHICKKRKHGKQKGAYRADCSDKMQAVPVGLVIASEIR